MHLLDVKNLRVRFETHHGTVHAVDGVSFYLEEGETLGLVGESGSGKSVTNLALMGLIPSPPGVVVAEKMMYGKRNLMKLSDQELRALRGNEIAMIFQDPMTSLNPLLTIERQLTEVLMLHKGKSRREARKLAAAGLGDVGIPSPEERLDAYPHELSGGMRQRVMIAMSLLCKPRILIADEPTTALDVTIQAQILELMKDMQKKYGMAIIMVTHDLGVVAGMTDRINVMYAGRIAETAQVDDLFQRPLHPYTRGLLQSVPTLTGDPGADLYSIPGAPPDLASLPKGCSFGPRCELHTVRCDKDKPTLRQLNDEVSGARRRVACVEVEVSDDPNKELFAELERQEREGAPGGAVEWKPEDGPPGSGVHPPAPEEQAPPEPSETGLNPGIEEPVEPEPARTLNPGNFAPTFQDTARTTDADDGNGTADDIRPLKEAGELDEHLPGPAETDPALQRKLPETEADESSENPFALGTTVPGTTESESTTAAEPTDEAAPEPADHPANDLTSDESPTPPDEDAASDPFASEPEEGESLEVALDLDGVEAEFEDDLADELRSELDDGEWKVFGGDTSENDDQKRKDAEDKS